MLKMVLCSRICEVFVALVLHVLLRSSFIHGVESDINCLKSIKQSLDPSGALLPSWNFSNSTAGFTCKFTGVECWHPDEDKVLNVRLSNMALKGSFPRGIKNCSSLTGLDLSNNKLSGQIPEDICELVEFVTLLDLSVNAFSGPIPKRLANCSYLNVLKLDNNQLSGVIPPELALLSRIRTFSVRSNLLTGPVPNFSNRSVADASSYANNPGLCGGPLGDCKGSQAKSRTAIVVASAVGGATVAALAVGVGLAFFFRRVAVRKKEEDIEGNKWARTIKKTKAIKVSMFEKSVAKMRLSDLMKATNDFSKSNIIGTGRTGTVYRATLDDGSALMVKRLQESHHSEKEFISEMAILGNVKHHNLVPLLGFCVAKRERLLVYNHMANGNLHEQLHPIEENSERLDWPTRLKIAIGAAKGFAWLHHTCNPRILHRNISSKCILLDSDFEPKISDFGLARLMNPIDTHLSTFVNGEFGDLGYVAPEYTRTLVATPKGDVYSFGIVLLELVTGERPTHVSKAHESFKGSLVEWIAQFSGNEELRGAIDDSLAGKGVDGELFQFLKVACNCVVATAKERPSMFEVYQLLRAIGENYHFTVDDEMTMPSEYESADRFEELIVARDVERK